MNEKVFLNSIYDLIDTQWNVNDVGRDIDEADKNDLIDTQWNVNYLDPAILKDTFGFNRYIVECK